VYSKRSYDGDYEKEGENARSQQNNSSLTAWSGISRLLKQSGLVKTILSEDWVWR